MPQQKGPLESSHCLPLLGDNSSWRHDKMFFSLNKELAVAQNNNTTKEQLGEPRSLFGLFLGVWVRICLKKCGQLKCTGITGHLLQRG